MTSAGSHELQGYWLAAGIFLLLVTATLAGWILKLRATNAQIHARAIENLNARIHSWWIIAGAFALAVWSGRAAVILLFAGASALALREFLRAVTKPHGSAAWGGLLVVTALQYGFVWSQWHVAHALVVPGIALMLMTTSTRLRVTRQAALQYACALLLCVYAVSHVPALLSLSIPGDASRNLFLLAFLVVITQLSDVLQYVFGKLLGRHTIAPRISPAKTVEGTIGGIACASALGVLLAPITPFSTIQAAVIAFAVTVLGFVGGLLLSALKRSRGIKDWSGFIPGHGGVLDRLDSLVLSAPFFYYVVSIGWAR